ncbi:Retrovirus-related Pol polyprotein from transposon 297-like Protein [Tribolium castaneum]|uniref:Retrovirus-related Pol polyprotein from transposon 297-like Protein n=1 Tax=Tribolium castaneum TaxID=7070 RepID=D7EJU2_TRICA|nr:Retrovirus-related Pol polyprotein from transposon 297-like Protein [Tribolium castaneum]
MSKNTPGTSRQQHKNQINYNEATTDQSSSESSFKLTIENVNSISNIPKVKIDVDRTKIDFVIDTGSSVNIISTKTVKQLLKQQLKHVTTCVLLHNSRQQLELVGKFQATLTYNKTKIEVDILVVRGSAESVLSFETSKQLSLIQMSLSNNVRLSANDVQKKYLNLFRGIGNLKGTTVKLHINTNVPPVANKHRRFSFHLRAKVEEEIQRLEQQGIVEKAIGETLWISPIVIVSRKNQDKMRICVDMREANKAIKRERHPTPSIDEIISTLNGATVFSKIDLNDAYHQLTLDENSCYITVFSTHISLYRYKRLNFGINSAAEIFQNTISQLLSDISGILNFSDDILIFGKSQAQHDKTLNQVLNRLSSKNLTVNPKKCTFNTNRIKFIGYISSRWYTPRPVKSAMCHEFRTPKRST